MDLNDDTVRSADVVSLAGQPIYRHGAPSEWQAPQGEDCCEQISDHIEQYLGRAETVFHEIFSDTVHIDVFWVKPSEDFPFHRLVTSGMSDLPMRTPEGAPRFAELMMTLPADWQVDQASFEDEAWYWPVRLLKMLARLPHKHDTWLGFGHTVPNGDPPEPYAANTALCGAIILPSISAPQAFHRLPIDSGKEITFYAVVPLFENEMNLKLRKGVDELLSLFDKRKVSDIVDLARADVSKKRFGIF
ncbi:suppressor of fused domain protein [Pseudoduganella sp.]|uniref:suppressor of fused domain protein n=1 Tax=Pseudoduganella sp. TaxID=1880898 RepID=UPI0035B06E3E